MKKRLIIIAVILAALLLMTFRYSIIEQEDVLPDDVRYGLADLFGRALAETEQPQPTEPPAPEPTPIPTPEPLLERGDSGEEVRALQQRLRELGFMTGAADGKFGPKTEQAVVEFKKHLYELEQERAAAMAQAAGEMEEAAGLNEMAGQDNPSENADGKAGPSGDTHAPGAEQQENQDESSDSFPAGTVSEDAAQALPGLTGKAEPAADEADAQAEADSLPAELAAQTQAPEPVFEGKADEATYRMLIEKGFDEYQEKLVSGSRGAEVRRLQTRLKTLGFLAGKADGIFGRQTTNAVRAFQQQHKLTQDGIAGEKTQRALYSASAKKYVPPVPRQPKGKPYLLKVSTKDQRVYAYSWNEKDGAYTNLARTMVCSTGLKDTPTPKGTYTNTNPVVRWGYFPKYDVWAQYLYRISGPYLFHSVLYDEADESTVKWGSVNKLGSPASHGCIRLKVEDAKWIYMNCPAGTTVTVY